MEHPVTLAEAELWAADQDERTVRRVYEASQVFYLNPIREGHQFTAEQRAAASMATFELAILTEAHRR
jgi:flagellar biosynthesis regulator FlbT